MPGDGRVGEYVMTALTLIVALAIIVAFIWWLWS